MPSGSARAVGLFGLHSQTTVAPQSATAARMAGASSANPAASAEARHRHDRAAALLGHDAVHRVGRYRDDGACRRP